MSTSGSSGEWGRLVHITTFLCCEKLPAPFPQPSFPSCISHLRFHALELEQVGRCCVCAFQCPLYETFPLVWFSMAFCDSLPELNDLVSV